MDKDEAYGLLSELVFKGFLTAEYDINGQIMIFKTVNDKEFDLIKFYSGDPERKGYQGRFNTYFLIFSLFILNNRNMLVNRNEQVPELFKFFDKFPEKLCRAMIENLNKVTAESYSCVKYLEGFSYSTRSAWKTLANNLPTDEEFSGIPGTSGLGLNIHQENWVGIHRLLDDEEEHNKDFGLALLVASSSNPKGARHIRNQFDSSKKMAEDRRKKIMKEGYIDTRKWTSEGWAAPVDTAEELVAELERQMTGVKDRHDIFMEKYMAKMKEAAEKKTRDAEEKIKKLREGREEFLIDGSQHAMTPEEAKKLLIKPSTTQMVPEQILTEEDKNKFYSKIGTKILTGK